MSTTNLVTTTSPAIPMFAAPKEDAMVQSYIYVAFGLPIAVLNALILLTILTTSKLRSRTEMALLVFWTGLDSIAGIGFLAAGIKQLTLPLVAPSVRPFDCITYFYSHFVFIPQVGIPFVMTAVSIDRLICVLSYSKYGLLGKWYPVAILGIPSLAITGLWLVCWVLAVNMPTTLTANPRGLMTNAIPAWYLTTINWIQMVVCLLGIGIYIAVMAIFWYKRPAAADAAKGRNAQARGRQRQRRITAFLALVSLVTFGSYVVPCCLIILSNAFSLGINGMNGAKCVHSFVFAVIFYVRKSDVRDRMVYYMKILWLGKKSNAVGGANMESSIGTAVSHTSRPNLQIL